ncbi:MAG: hypothetical protein L0Z53_06960 [Acidobacteriales bacterium]|nr:hypothetical protein [Terriglobales bacterium]
MDYTQFLQQPGEVLRLPYFEGKSVCDDKLTYRLRDVLQPGWYEFRKSGRYLEVGNAVEPELDAWRLKRLRGYAMASRFIGDDLQARLFGMPRDEDLPKFAPISVCKWFDGHLLYYGREFESDVEPRVREAFEEQRTIEPIKGITPALAHVYLLETTQRALKLEAERRARQAEEIARWQQTLEGRISLALSHTGASLISWRRNSRDQAVVRYRIASRPFECVIDTNTLQIVDAGICLSGADDQLNLSSLPSAVREAIQTGQLHVFREG